MSRFDLELLWIDDLLSFQCRGPWSVVIHVCLRGKCHFKSNFDE